MTSSLELTIEISESYDFNRNGLQHIEQNTWVRNHWPLVYFIQNESQKIAYVGESTYALSRIKDHLGNPAKSLVLDKISIIGSDKFNKSATLDIEAQLIQFISAEGSYKLLNGNYGLVNHRYYQQDLYKNLFKEVWQKLIAKRIVTKSLREIENSEVFKYSPYKSLNEDQYKSVLQILGCLSSNMTNTIFIRGSAGTGKTILATYLIKLLNSNIDDAGVDEFNNEELKEVRYIKQFQSKYPDAKIALVVAMTSLRVSLQNVFRKIPGLRADMVISPSDTVHAKEKFDLLIVDEAHRLRKFRNIGWLGVFRKNNAKLGLDDSGNELDWILANSRNQVFFYDSDQSIKPSDVDGKYFNTLLDDPRTVQIQLVSQMRISGGNDYISFVDDLLHVRVDNLPGNQIRNYELLFFDSLRDLYKELETREKKSGLSRLVAGYSWPWRSKKDKTVMDIEIEGLEFKWNQTDRDWINSPNAFHEIGCIHTTQGYDLNYTGVIFGREIDFNPITNEIEIDPALYHDRNGKTSISANELKSFIINIYKTLMYRGIKGTFLYAMNPGLRKYFKTLLPAYENDLPFRVLNPADVIPYVNAIPLLDIAVAAGTFSEQPVSQDTEWIELPFGTMPQKGYFVCKVVGNSMNRVIPNGAYCLFRQDEGGSRNGKIVLVQSSEIQDKDFGLGYTIKQYSSKKSVTAGGWRHESITLTPMSDDENYRSIELEGHALKTFSVVGIFVKVL